MRSKSAAAMGLGVLFAHAKLRQASLDQERHKLALPLMQGCGMVLVVSGYRVTAGGENGL